MTCLPTCCYTLDIGASNFGVISGVPGVIPIVGVSVLFRGFDWAITDTYEGGSTLDGNGVVVLAGTLGERVRREANSRPLGKQKLFFSLRLLLESPEWLLRFSFEDVWWLFEKGVLSIIDILVVVYTAVRP